MQFISLNDHSHITFSTTGPTVTKWRSLSNAPPPSTLTSWWPGSRISWTTRRSSRARLESPSLTTSSILPRLSSRDYSEFTPMFITNTLRFERISLLESFPIILVCCRRLCLSARKLISTHLSNILSTSYRSSNWSIGKSWRRCRSWLIDWPRAQLRNDLVTVRDAHIMLLLLRYHQVINKRTIITLHLYKYRLYCI